jgi:type I restriction enzyme S subunit
MSATLINQDDLPTTWALTNLGSVVNYGNTNKAEPNDIADGDWILELEDIEKDSSRLLQKITFLQRQSKSTKNHFQAGDVLYGKLRPYLNKVLIAGESGYCTTEILPLKAGSHIDNRYLFYWLKHPVFLKYVEAESHGMNMPRLGTETGKAAPFVLAPRNEQTRIANQLDTLLTRVQACNDRFDATPALLKRFRNSVLAAAVSGRLTGDLRSEDSIAHNSTTSSLWRIPASWRWVRADEVTGFITKGTTPSKEKMTSGRGEVPYIKVYNLGFDGRLDFSVDPTFVDSTTHSVDLKRSITLPGDVLMNIVGPPLGKVAIVPDSHQEWNINQAIARFRPVQGLLSPYLAHCLMSKELISYAVSQAKATVGQLNLTLEICRALPIPMPPEKEQTEIVRRVEVLFALADRIEARCTAARIQAQRLTPLVLAKAFRGELVPQDPNDEPTSALLARIASAKAAVVGNHKRKVPVALKELAQVAINL